MRWCIRLRDQCAIGAAIGLRGLRMMVKKGDSEQGCRTKFPVALVRIWSLVPMMLRGRGFSDFSVGEVSEWDCA